MMEVTVQQEHRWLQQMVGEWTWESEATMEPGKPPEKFGGTETVRSLGDLWIVAEGEGMMLGDSVHKTMMTLGYDPLKKRFVGTWLGSMMGYLWIYEGVLDRDEKVLTLDAEGPSMEVEGEIRPYQDIIEFRSDDHRVLRSQIQSANGQWHHFMTANYRRTK